MENIQQNAAADGVEFFAEYAEPAIAEEIKLEVEKFIDIDLLRKETEKELLNKKRKEPNSVKNLYRLGLFLVVVREDFTRAELTLKLCNRVGADYNKPPIRFFVAMALLYWMLGKPKEERFDKAKVWFDKAINSYEPGIDQDYNIYGDYALFCESQRTPSNLEKAFKYYKKALKSASKQALPVILCNYATFIYQTPPHSFDLAEKHFRHSLNIVTKEKIWIEKNRGMFIQHSYNIFKAAYAIKIASTAVHGDEKWEKVFHELLDSSGIENVQDFFPFDLSLRPLILSVVEDFQLCSSLAEQPEEFGLIQDICNTMKVHCEESPQDYRSHWRYAMVLWHCMDDLEAAKNIFQQMLDCTVPTEPSCEAYIDCALFFQHLAKSGPDKDTGIARRNKEAISMAEKVFLRALHAQNGHTNGLCLAYASLFYYHDKIDRVKAAQYKANAIHADPSMEGFLEERIEEDADGLIE